MNDDEIARRKKITFAQAEGADPLPRQLARSEVSQELRAVVRKYIHDESTENGGSGWYLVKPWSHILEQVHIYHFTDW
jgi:hypothetical protein